MGLDTAQVSGVRGMAGWDPLLLVPNEVPSPASALSILQGTAAHAGRCFGTGLPRAPSCWGLLLHSRLPLDRNGFLVGSENGSLQLLGVGDSISVSVHDRVLSCYSVAVGSWMGHCGVLSFHPAHSGSRRAG